MTINFTSLFAGDLDEKAGFQAQGKMRTAVYRDGKK